MDWAHLAKVMLNLVNNACFANTLMDVIISYFSAKLEEKGEFAFKMHRVDNGRDKGYQN